MTFNGKLYDALPLMLFAVSTIGGGIIIVMSKMAGIDPFLTMGIPVIVMFVYLGLSLFLRRLKLHTEQTGDNLYYMGFLFTLASLGTSLYQFDSGGSMDDVVRNFGVAITSTIFGILLRILFTQARRDIQDIEDTTRYQLSNAARALLTEMNLARREFTEYRRVNNQMINEGFNEIIKRTNATSKKMTDALEEASKQMTAAFDAMAKEALKPIQEASTSFAGTVTDSTKEIATKLGNISTMLDSSATKINNTAKRIDSIQLPSEVIKNDLAPVIEQMGQRAAEMSEKFEGATQEQVKLFTDMSSKFEEMTDEQMKIIGELTEKFMVSRSEQGKVTKDVTDAVSQMVDQMKLSIAQMEQVIEANKQTVQKTEEITKVAETTVAQAEQNKETVQTLTRKADQLDEKVDKAVAEVRSIKDILNRVLSAFGTKTKEEEKPAPAPTPAVEVTPIHTATQVEVLTAQVSEEPQTQEAQPESSPTDSEPEMAVARA